MSEGITDADDDDAGATALLPADLLQPGEIIILILKPSLWFILLAPLSTLAILVLGILAATIARGYGLFDLNQRDVVLLGLALIGLRLFWQFLDWLCRVYVLTDQRVIDIRGVVRVLVFEAPLSRIQHTNLIFSLRERLFSLGTIGFATSGTSITEAFWLMIPRPLEVHQKVVETLKRYGR